MKILKEVILLSLFIGLSSQGDALETLKNWDFASGALMMDNLSNVTHLSLDFGDPNIDPLDFLNGIKDLEFPKEEFDFLVLEEFLIEYKLKQIEREAKEGKGSLKSNGNKYTSAVYPMWKDSKASLFFEDLVFPLYNNDNIKISQTMPDAQFALILDGDKTSKTNLVVQKPKGNTKENFCTYISQLLKLFVQENKLELKISERYQGAASSLLPPAVFNALEKCKSNFSNTITEKIKFSTGLLVKNNESKDEKSKILNHDLYLISELFSLYRLLGNLPRTNKLKSSDATTFSSKFKLMIIKHAFSKFIHEFAESKDGDQKEQIEELLLKRLDSNMPFIDNFRSLVKESLPDILKRQME